MKKTFASISLLILLTCHAEAQTRAVLKTVPGPGVGDNALLEPFATGAQAITISAAGTLEFKSGFTLTGGSYLKTALSLNNVENTALSTWAGSANITTLGTITAGTWNGTTIAIANGGTGSTTAAAARSALGLAIAVNVQAYDADLTTYAGITPSANVQSLLGAADYAAMRTLLGLVINIDVQPYNANTTLLGSSIDLTSEITGTLPAANGGTGQTSLQAGINALLAASGALSQGDVFYYNGTNVVRLAAGTSGHYLKTQGAGANPMWAAVPSTLTVGSTTISGGTSGYIPYNNAGVYGELATTGSGSVVRATSPVLITPSIGDASATSINGMLLKNYNAVYSMYFGYFSGNAALSGDAKNTAFGAYALAAATGGGADTANSAFGYSALGSLVGGKSNTAVGDGSLYSEASGSNNTAIGVHSMLNANGASNNVAIGSDCMSGLSTGTGNVAAGMSALHAAVTGQDNVAIGRLAGESVTSGGSNVLLGPRSGDSVTTGSSNVCIGLIAGYSISTGSYNVCIGQSAGQSVTGNYGVYIGFEAGKNETGSNKLYIDNSSTETPLIGGDFSANTVTIGGTLTINGGSQVSKILTATATLDFDLTSSMVEDLTVTVTGAAVGDDVVIGVPNGSMTATSTFFGWVSATNTVSIRCRTAAIGENPSSGTFRATVIQH